MQATSKQIQNRKLQGVEEAEVVSGTMLSSNLFTSDIKEVSDVFSLQGVGTLFLQTLTDCYLLGQDARRQVVDASVHMCPPRHRAPPGAISVTSALMSLMSGAPATGSWRSEKADTENKGTVSSTKR